MKKINPDKITAKQLKPLWDNVVVMPIKIEKKGKFLRPQQEEDKSELGEIVSVGEAVKDAFKKGDLVLFNKYSSIKVDIGEELIVRAEDIVGIFK